jgi:transposase InsO family protein
VLDRKFEPAQPNGSWAGDITYMWTAEGWLYLAVLLDLFSRRVVGWAMSEKIDREFATSQQAFNPSYDWRLPKRGVGGRRVLQERRHHRFEYLRLP